MSATNKTTHYELPVFLGSDKPAWLVDWNGAMAAIDAAIYEAYTTAQSASSSAASVASDLATLSGTVSTQGTSITTLTDTLTTLVGTVNTITSLIGNGEPTTTDKTIIGAINEINAKIPAGGTTAAGVSYDNTTSGLTADDVQEAIDELEVQIQNFTPVSAQDRIVVIADSYGDTTYCPTPWTTVLQSLTGLTGANFYSFFEDAMGYAHQGTGGHNAKTFLESKESDISDPDTITKIIFGLGINDMSEVGNISSAITTLVTYCKATYPNAKLYFAFVGNKVNKAADFNNYQKIVVEIEKAVNDNKCINLSNAVYVLHDCRLLSADNVHPNDNGSAAIAQHIYNFLLGNNPDVIFDDHISNSSVVADVYVKNGQCRLQFSTALISSTVSITSPSWVSIGSNVLNAFAVRGDTGNAVIEDCYVYVSGAWKHAQLGIINGSLFVRYPEGSGAASVDLSQGQLTTPVTHNTLFV